MYLSNRKMIEIAFCKAKEELQLYLKDNDFDSNKCIELMVNGTFSRVEQMEISYAEENLDKRSINRLKKFWKGFWGK